MRDRVCRLVCCVPLVSLALASLAPAQRVLEVPKQYPTIQAAIDAASDQDTVLVAPGRYVETIDYKHKSITVRSSMGPLVTTIDGNQAVQPVVHNLAWTSSRSSVLEGFTITNGGQGGIRADAMAVIRNNIITRNYNPIDAGGIRADDSVEILANVITLNVGARGGGIGWYGSRNLLKVKDNYIADNYSVSHGGGILTEGNGDVVNNVIVRNTAQTGGGIGNPGFNAPTLNIAGNLIRDNAAMQDGGGIAAQLTTVFLDSNTIGKNMTAGHGGGLYLAAATVAGRNNILWENTARYKWGAEAWVGDDALGGSKLSLAFSVVKGALTSIVVGSKSTLDWGPVMASVDPQFVDLVGGDLHLRADSPYIDKGDGSAVVIPTDFEGDPRIVGLNVDIGADEFHPHLYVFGRAAPATTFAVKFIGPPSAPVVWGVSGNPLPRTPPIPIPGVGTFQLADPFSILALGALPASGSLAVPITLPASFPAPLPVPMQALIGTKLSNLEIASIR
ncbi:MAG: hypothetical protein JXQ29_12065 [Planctomycetes bacterium]|nr:hypothetical protein [Planctomycetota bacterium]